MTIYGDDIVAVCDYCDEVIDRIDIDQERLAAHGPVCHDCAAVWLLEEHEI